MISIKMHVDPGLFDAKAFVDAIERAQKDVTGPGIRAQFQRTVASWKDKPSFTIQQRTTSNSISVKVFADGTGAKVYGLVNAGSPSHPIDARQGGILRFRPGYRSASTPRLIGSRAAARSGAFVTARAVPHPGFEPREFDDAVAEYYAPKFVKEMNDAIKNIKF